MNIIRNLCIIVLFFFSSLLSQNQTYDNNIPYNVTNICFFPNSKIILGETRYDSLITIKFWSVENGDLLDEIRYDSVGSIRSLAVSHSGSKIALSGRLFFRPNKENYSLSEIDIKNYFACYDLGQKKWIWKVLDEYYSCNILFSSDDQNIIATVGLAGLLSINSNTGELSAINYTPWKKMRISNSMPADEVISNNVKYMALWQDAFYEYGDQSIFAKFHNWIFRTRQHDYIRIYDLQNEEIIAEIEREVPNPIGAVSFTNDEEQVLIFVSGNYFKLWSISEKKVVKRWKSSDFVGSQIGENRRNYLTISSDKKHFALRKNFDVEVWSLQDTVIVKKFNDVYNVLSSCNDPLILFSPNSEFFVIEIKARLILYDTNTWKEIWNVPSRPEKN